MEAYQSEMMRICQRCREYRIPMLACLLPSPRAIAGDSQGRQFDLPAQQARSVFAAAQVAVCDLTPMLRQAGVKQTYFAWDQHLNPTGNRIAAETIAKAWLDLTK